MKQKDNHMKRSILLASLLAVASLSFAAVPTPTAAQNTAAVKKYQKNSAAAKAVHMKNVRQGHVTPRKPTAAAKAASK
jgi:protein-disulfide isomerase